MTTPKNEPRFDGYSERITVGGHRLPQESGVLPPDFPERLTRLKEASGLSWSGLAQAIGVDRKQIGRWLNGTEPCGGAMLSLFRFASRMPGGLDILLGDMDVAMPEPEPDEEDGDGEDGEEDQEA